MNILRAIKFLKKGKGAFRLDGWFKNGCIRLSSFKINDPYGNPKIETKVTLCTPSRKEPYVFTKEDLDSDGWMITG